MSIPLVLAVEVPVDMLAEDLGVMLVIAEPIEQLDPMSISIVDSEAIVLVCKFYL